MSQSRRLLSIQSHVSHGYVGNSAAIPILQSLGWDVDAIHTVLFACHTGYPHLKGRVVTVEEFRELADGLRMNRLLDYNYILTGYIGSDHILDELSTLIQDIQKLSPNVRYILDPVLGDDGAYYTSRTLKDGYLQKLINLSYLITPNKFEAEELLGRKISSENELLRSLFDLAEYGPRLIAITSAEWPDSRGGDLISCYLLDTATPFQATITKIVVSKLSGYFTGTGDITSAILLSWIDHFEKQYKSSVVAADSSPKTITSQGYMYDFDDLSSMLSDTIPWDHFEDMEAGSGEVLPQEKWICRTRAFQYTMASVQAVLIQTQRKMDQLQGLNDTNMPADKDDKQAYDAKVREIDIIGSREYIAHPEMFAKPEGVLLDTFILHVTR